MSDRMPLASVATKRKRKTKINLYIWLDCSTHHNCSFERFSRLNSSISTKIDLIRASPNKPLHRQYIKMLNMFLISFLLCVWSRPFHERDRHYTDFHKLISIIVVQIQQNFVPSILWRFFSSSFFFLFFIQNEKFSFPSLAANFCSLLLDITFVIICSMMLHLHLHANASYHHHHNNSSVVACTSACCIFHSEKHRKEENYKVSLKTLFRRINTYIIKH